MLTSACDDFAQLDQVAEWVGGIDTQEAGNRRIVLHRMTGGPQRRRHGCQCINDQTRMGIQGRLKCRINAQMQLQRPALEPQAAARLQSGRLGQFRHAEDAAEKVPCSIFASGWHGELNMVNGGNWHDDDPLGWLCWCSRCQMPIWSSDSSPLPKAPLALPGNRAKRLLDKTSPL